MIISKSHLACCLFLLLPLVTSCGQKGPLYLDNGSQDTARRVSPKDEERRKELEELESQNPSQPELTY